MTKVKVTWKAFGDKPQIGRFVSSVKFTLPEVVSKTVSDEHICETIFKQTNLYNGPVWMLSSHCFQKHALTQRFQ